MGKSVTTKSSIIKMADPAYTLPFELTHHLAFILKSQLARTGVHWKAIPKKKAIPVHAIATMAILTQKRNRSLGKILR
jgi:hypothetical protein